MSNIIETERLFLRTWEFSDIDSMVDGLGNECVAKNLTTPYPYTKTNAKEYIEKHVSDVITSDSLGLAVTLKTTGEVIGGTGINFNNGIIEGGMWLREIFFGNGYATEFWRERAKFCFEKLGALKIESGFFEGNVASWNVQKKVGFDLTCAVKTGSCPARGGSAIAIKTYLTKDMLK